MNDSGSKSISGLGSRVELSSLVPIGISLGEIFRCERVDFDFVNVDSGEIVSGRCKAYACDFCGPRKLRLAEVALALARPQRWVTLTWAPDDHRRRRQQVYDLTRRLRRDGLEWNVAWSSEPNPNPDASPAGRGTHVHLLQKGSYVAQAHLQKRWGAIAHITRLQVDESRLGGPSPEGPLRAGAAGGGPIGNAVAAYMLKAHSGSMRAAGYALKHQTGTRQRPVNVSRDFFDGLTFMQAKSHARELLFGPPEQRGSWLRVARGGEKNAGALSR